MTEGTIPCPATFALGDRRIKCQRLHKKAYLPHRRHEYIRALPGGGELCVRWLVSLEYALAAARLKEARAAEHETGLRPTATSRSETTAIPSTARPAMSNSRHRPCARCGQPIPPSKLFKAGPRGEWCRGCWDEDMQRLIEEARKDGGRDECDAAPRPRRDARARTEGGVDG